MLRKEIETLLGLHDIVEANLGRKPTEIALDKHIPSAALVATQVKYLQRAERKIPSWFEARCIIPPLEFEQASSQKTALHKAFRGKLAVDLTCGLGVDTWAFAQNFERVIAVERDPDRAFLARVNFELLGLKNVEVVNSAAEDFEIPEDADFIYIDADRRGAHGEKRVLLEHCSPDIISLIPRLKGRRTMLKLSPMFDVDEALRLIGGRVEVVSSGGEVREVLIEIPGEPSVAATVLGFGTIENPPVVTPVSLPELNYLIAPDAALVKARLATQYFASCGLYIESNTGFAFSEKLPTDIPGRVYRILFVEPYSPKTLKKRGIQRADIMVRDFPQSVSQVSVVTGIREGGTQTLAFTTVAGRKITLILERM